MPRTILSVDDEPDITDLARFHLSRAGFEVLTAGSGREAIEIITTRHPDLVLLDLMLPDIDGFGVCEILRRAPDTAAIPIIILSAWSTSEARALGMDYGVLEYVTKPFSPSDLVNRVRRLLSPAGTKPAAAPPP